MEMLSFLICPRCRGDLVSEHDAFVCRPCSRGYPLEDGVPQFDPPQTSPGDVDAAARDERRTYWDSGWEERYQKDHAHLSRLQTREQWEPFLADLVEHLRKSRHASYVEAGKQAVQGKTMIDIGCGGGTESALFGHYGAHYIGIDHSPHAARYSLRHLRAVGGDGFTVQGNAEFLPIRSNSLDVVYSNGVLHHTPRFSVAMDEAYRILKPGGKAVIALYATYSTLFGVVRLLGILKGRFTRASMERWMGAQTEGDWRTGDRVNLWTETFSKAEMRGLVRKYAARNATIRKNGNPILEIPRLGPILMRSGLARALDRALEPLLGSMVILTFEK